MVALMKLLARCKCGVYLTVNEHKDVYKSAKDKLQWFSEMECPPEIADEVRSGILSSGNIVDLQFYPDTPIGSYHIVHHDLAEALMEALACVGIESA
jgi:hypothetical protein